MRWIIRSMNVEYFELRSYYLLRCILLLLVRRTSGSNRWGHIYKFCSENLFLFDHKQLQHLKQPISISRIK